LLAVTGSRLGRDLTELSTDAKRKNPGFMNPGPCFSPALSADQVRGRVRIMKVS
jgi:hypothetical protein